MMGINKQISDIIARKLAPVLLVIGGAFTSCNLSRPLVVTRVELHQDIFGVESDMIPAIDAVIDFAHDTSFCKTSYYSPAFKPTTYRLSKKEMGEVLQLLQTTDLEKLKPNYAISASDQPSSIMTVYKGGKKYVFKDYGLKGDTPLPEIYKIVYKY